MPKKPDPTRKQPGTGKKGGIRPNQTGRPKRIRDFSEAIKKDVVGALKRKAEANGKTFGDLLVESAWGTGHFALKATAMKLIAEILVVKESKQTRIEEKKTPTIYLPADRPVTEEAHEQKPLVGKVVVQEQDEAQVGLH